jgi:hypothetical protein
MSQLHMVNTLQERDLTLRCRSYVLDDSNDGYCSSKFGSTVSTVATECQESDTSVVIDLVMSAQKQDVWSRVFARQIQVILINSASSTPSATFTPYWTSAVLASTTQGSTSPGNNEPLSTPNLERQKTSKGAIAGIVAGVVVVLLLALAALLFMHRRKQQRQGVLPSSGNGSFNWSALPELVTKRGAKGSSSAEMSMAHPNDDVSGPVTARAD